MTFSFCAYPTSNKGKKTIIQHQTKEIDVCCEMNALNYSNCYDFFKQKTENKLVSERECSQGQRTMLSFTRVGQQHGAIYKLHAKDESEHFI
mgnify:CR=1 FL=1